MGRRLRSLLGSEYLRTLLFRARRWYFMGLRKRLRTIDSAAAFNLTVPHNLKMVSVPLPRMELLIRPLSVIEFLGPDSKVLLIRRSEMLASPASLWKRSITSRC